MQECSFLCFQRNLLSGCQKKTLVQQHIAYSLENLSFSTIIHDSGIITDTLLSDVGDLSLTGWCAGSVCWVTNLFFPICISLHQIVQ